MNNGNRDKKRKIGLKRELVRSMQDGELRLVAGGAPSQGCSNNTCPDQICYEY